MTPKKNPLRQQNLNQIAAAIFRRDSAFASELSEELDLSVVTVNSLVRQLLSDGYVTERPLVQREVGRPAAKYYFNYDAQHFVLVTIQEEHNVQEGRSDLVIKPHVVNLAGKIIATGATVDFSDYSAGTFIAAIKAASALAPDAAALGIAFPGKIDAGVILASWNDHFNGWNVANLIKQATDLPYFIQNDAHMMTAGYACLHALPESALTVGIYFPQRSMPGISIFTHNGLIQGHHSLAGEAKYTPELQQHGAPKTDAETAARLTELMVSYNVALAPDYFVLASNGVPNATFQAAIEGSDALHYHPNRFAVRYVTDFEAAMLVGLRWLILRGTPYAFTTTGMV